MAPPWPQKAPKLHKTRGRHGAAKKKWRAFRPVFHQILGEIPRAEYKKKEATTATTATARQKQSQTETESGLRSLLFLSRLMSEVTGRESGGPPVEPPPPVIVSCFHLVGPFFSSFFWNPYNSLFRSKSIPKGLQTGAQMSSFWIFFRANSENGEVCFDCAGVCGLHMRPSRGAPGSTQKR